MLLSGQGEGDEINWNFIGNFGGYFLFFCFLYQLVVIK